jgi:hypothetical protein
MPDRRVRIAQISDLHINRKIDPAVTRMLKTLLGKIGPDVLIISGDLANQPVPWQMRSAAKLVSEIQQCCARTRILVLPGNHDFKFWGSVGLRRLTRIPFEIYFRRNGLARSRGWRLKESLKLAVNALGWRGQAMREPLIVELFPDHPDWGIAIFAINSNTLAEMMAAGRVESLDLQELYSKNDRLSESPQYPFCYKIAVVHHHPAPIADAPSDAIARIQDSFMIFYNAGLFVRELSRRGFNLVLHGHKHVAGFLRVVCEFDDGRTVLPIAAAGTATHPHPDDSRGHHLHILDIFDDDTARLEARFFSADVEMKDESCFYVLDTVDDVRRRRYAAFRAARKLTIAEIRKTVEITNDGYSFIRIDALGCRVFGKEGIRSIPLSLSTVRPVYLRRVEVVAAMSKFAKVTSQKEALHKFEGSLDLPDIRKSDGGPFDFGYQYRLMNGHTLTAEEFARHYGGELDSEFATVTCEDACDLLVLSVQFPAGYDLDSLEPRAAADYVPAPLAGIKDSRLDLGQSRPHDDETQRIQGSLHREGKGFVLTCPAPVPGLIYKICWKFKKLAAEPKPLSITAEVDSMKERLIDMAMTAASDRKAAAQWGRASAILVELASDLSQMIGGHGEKLDINVMVFDEASRRLRFVCSNSDPQKLPSGSFYAGEGCAGFAFEKARYLLYHPARDPLGFFIHRHEWPSEAEQVPELAALASFPWIHNPEDDERRLVIGVINVSSTRSTTRLLGIFDATEEQKAHKMKTLQDLVNLAARRFFQL